VKAGMSFGKPDILRINLRLAGSSVKSIGVVWKERRNEVFVD